MRGIPPDYHLGQLEAALGMLLGGRDGAEVVHCVPIFIESISSISPFGRMDKNTGVRITHILPHT